MYTSVLQCDVLYQLCHPPVRRHLHGDLRGVLSLLQAGVEGGLGKEEGRMYKPILVKAPGGCRRNLLDSKGMRAHPEVQFSAVSGVQVSV